LFIDKGVAKIARQLGFDYAEAVVRTPVVFSEIGSGDLTTRLGNDGRRQASNSGRARLSP
jgi:hypothetical protein